MAGFKSSRWNVLWFGLSLVGLLWCTWHFVEAGELTIRSRRAAAVTIQGTSAYLFLGGWCVLTVSGLWKSTRDERTVSAAQWWLDVMFWAGVGLMVVGIFLGKRA